MDTDANTSMLLTMGMFDNVLPHWFEASNHRDKANRESNNISDLIAHPSKDECAFHWAIATRDFAALDAVIMAAINEDLKQIMGVGMDGVLGLLNQLAEMLGIEED